MDARLYRAALVAAALLSLGASHRTRNFIVTAATPQLATQIGDLAETYRRDLAHQWLGRELPPWSEPCPIFAQADPRLGAGGETSFVFVQGRPTSWRMKIFGPQDRMLDSVLPHEITHTVFATHFGRPLPRWADEGACTTVEHSSEKAKQHHLLIRFLTTGKGIPFNRMFAMMDYPPEMLPLYSQGYSVARYLIAQGGRKKFIEFVGAGLRHGDWNAAVRDHYGYDDLSDLQVTWNKWVQRGSPAVQPRSEQLAAQPSAAAPVALASATTDDRGRKLVPIRQAGGADTNPASGGITNAVASTASKGSWYARQRDQRDQNPTNAARGEQSGGAPDDAVRLADRGNPQAADQTTVTRPQPVGRPRQRVIEWSRQEGEGYRPGSTAGHGGIRFDAPIKSAAMLR